MNISIMWGYQGDILHGLNVHLQSRLKVLEQQGNNSIVFLYIEDMRD